MKGQFVILPLPNGSHGPNVIDPTIVRKTKCHCITYLYINALSVYKIKLRCGISHD